MQKAILLSLLLLSGCGIFRKEATLKTSPRLPYKKGEIIELPEGKTKLVILDDSTFTYQTKPVRKEPIISVNVKKDKSTTVQGNDNVLAGKKADQVKAEGEGAKAANKIEQKQTVKDKADNSTDNSTGFKIPWYAYIIAGIVVFLLVLARMYKPF